ncbi:MAG TPA: chromosome partitioning protein ParB [Pseudonocardia sp.]|uniref:chromosome partitioning protein ParB n=1 Tax=Pseudonocardia sp. TaxID=60912 RepID=UPI002B4B8D84|nr:chromosome partitioning protein ParB [Pseudonocardia sp.]HLU55032.1 chromosome partitioning protein ParB [Pseudonocardia sp.]
MADTGFPRTDAEHDFLRARRKATLARLAARLRREPDDVSEILPFDEVVAALGRTGERRLGLQVIPLDSIVGSVDRTRDFDRWFRPRSGRSRERWERLATAHRRGESIPPIGVYRVGELHFVRDGHHRVSVAHALGLRTIDAYVTEVTTKIDATGISRRGDLISKDLRRVFLDRVPLPGPALATILVTSPWSYAELSETVEAWGFRLMQQERRFLDRETVARRWYAEEYRPVVRMLAQADLIGDRTEAEAYLQLAGQRYQLMRTHRWDDEVIERLRSDKRRR